jgi:hypothetical protein
MANQLLAGVKTPETVTKKETVGDKEKERNPGEGRKGHQPRGDACAAQLFLLQWDQVVGLEGKACAVGERTAHARRQLDASGTAQGKQ